MQQTVLAEGLWLSSGDRFCVCWLSVFDVSEKVFEYVQERATFQKILPISTSAP